MPLAVTIGIMQGSGPMDIVELALVVGVGTSMGHGLADFYAAQCHSHVYGYGKNPGYGQNRCNYRSSRYYLNAGLRHTLLAAFTQLSKENNDEYQSFYNVRPRMKVKFLKRYSEICKCMRTTFGLKPLSRSMKPGR